MLALPGLILRLCLLNPLTLRIDGVLSWFVGLSRLALLFLQFTLHGVRLRFTGSFDLALLRETWLIRLALAEFPFLCGLILGGDAWAISLIFWPLS